MHLGSSRQRTYSKSGLTGHSTNINRVNIALHSKQSHHSIDSSLLLFNFHQLKEVMYSTVLSLLFVVAIGVIGYPIDTDGDHSAFHCTYQQHARKCFFYLN